MYIINIYHLYLKNYSLLNFKNNLEVYVVHGWPIAVANSGLKHELSSLA
jgi:hypothetical protein